MKKVGVLLALVCLLGGCSSENRAMQRAMDMRAVLLGGECAFDAEITADYGDRLHLFSMACQSDQDGAVTFSVSAPESIAGITGTLSASGGALTFADTALHFGLLADGQVAPVSAPWIFLKTLRSGYITSACEEGEQLHITVNDSFAEDALQLDIWLDRENSPVRGEILYDGSRILSLSVSNFQIR